MSNPISTSGDMSARALSSIASRAYEGAPRLARLLAMYRPYICPFEWLLETIPRDSRVLDVGCGVGLLGALLIETGRTRDITGFDSFEPAIRVAQTMARAASAHDPNLRANFLHLPVEAPWPSGPFDAVCIVDVMHHVPRPARRGVIHQAIDRLTGDGMLIYKDMVRRPRWRATANRLHDLVLAKQWIRYEPIQQVEVWASERGWHAVRRERASRWWYGHELRVFRRG